MNDVFAGIEEFLTIPVRVGAVEFPFTILRLILVLILPTLATLLFLRLLRFGLRTILRKSSMGEELQSKLLRRIGLSLRIVFVAVVLILSGTLFGAEVGRYIEGLLSILSTPLVESGSTRITIVTIILIIPIFYVASWLGKKAQKLIKPTLLKQIGLDESRQFSATTLIQYGVMVLAVVLGFSIIGVDLSSLAVLFGVLGIGLGFGLQGVVANFFAGLIVVFTCPVRKDDRILVNDLEGTVVQVRLLSTVVSTLYHEVIIIPNSKLVDNIIHNFSHDDRQVIIGNSVQVSYESDLNQVIDILTRVGNRNPEKVDEKALGDEAVTVRVSSFNDSGITMKLFVRVKDISMKYAAISWNNLEIWKEFKAEGITIPFPQLDLHVKRPRSVTVPELGNEARDPGGGGTTD